MSFSNLLTIAIPCFERKEFFGDALQSALNQSVKCEVIVVDNNSSHDYFKKICESKGVKYFRNSANIGLFPNINRCYELAETEYVKILDDDDLLFPEYVESFLKAKKRHPDIDVYYTDYILFTSTKEKPHLEFFPLGYMNTGTEIIEYGINHRLAFPYMTSAVRKSVAKLDLDTKDCLGGYDYVWVYSKAGELNFFGDSKKLHKYRIHDGKASHRDRDWVANVLTASYIYDTIIRTKVFEETKKNKIKKNIFWGFVLLKSYGKKREIINLINSENRFGQYLNDKLCSSPYLKVLFLLPQLLVGMFYKISRKFGITGKVLK